MSAQNIRLALFRNYIFYDDLLLLRKHVTWILTVSCTAVLEYLLLKIVYHNSQYIL